MNSRIQTKSAEPVAGYNVAFTWTISLVAALGGLLFGYDWVVIGGAKPFYEKFFNLTNPSQQGWAMSCALLGCLIGAFISGSLSDRFGRKRLLIFSAALFAISSVGTGMAQSFGAFVRWRISGGVAIGLASNLSPMYIAEISPAHVRGKMVSVNQLTIVVGILLAQFVNWLIAKPVPPNATAQDILNRRARRPPLRPRPQRLLVRLAAFHRGDAAAGAIPKRHRIAGDVGRARRHRLDAGKPRSRYRRGRRDGF